VLENPAGPSKPSTHFSVPVAIPNWLRTDINRPADPANGVFVPPLMGHITPGLPTFVRTEIPNGFTPTGAFFVSLKWLANEAAHFNGTYAVNYVSPQEFTLALDTRSLTQKRSYIAELGNILISPARVNSI